MKIYIDTTGSPILVRSQVNGIAAHHCSCLLTRGDCYVDYLCGDFVFGESTLAEMELCYMYPMPEGFYA